MRNRNENERGNVAGNRNLPASQQDRDAERNRQKQQPGSQEERGKAGQQRPQEPGAGQREGGSKGSQSNWSPGRSSTESEGFRPGTEDEDRDPDRRDRGQNQVP